MEAFVVEGGVALRGEARVDSAKNAVLPILAAAVLTPEEIVLHNVPDITDVGHMAAILTMLGCRVERSGRDMTVDCGGIHSWEMPDQLSKQIRSSIFLLGPILARFRKATVTFPGGCEIACGPLICICRACGSWAWKSPKRAGSSIAMDGTCMPGKCILTIPAWAPRKT